jgi:branched-subunit amino acid transport protein
MSVWLVVVAAGLGSYLFRVSMLVLAARVGLPPFIERAARHAVPVAFAALATTAVAGTVALEPAAIAPIAAVAAAVVGVRRTGSPHTALVAGMPTFWALSAVLPA